MKRNLLKYTPLAVLVVGVLGGSSLVSAASVEVELNEPKKFRDYEVTGFTRNKSIEVVQKDIKELFTKVSKSFIKETDVLSIEVTDLDLAGDIDYFVGRTGQNLRVVENNDRYKLSFNYQVKDSNGKVIKEGEKEIKEFLNRLPNSRISSKFTNLNYMEKPLKDWFKKEFN